MSEKSSNAFQFQPRRDPPDVTPVAIDMVERVWSLVRSMIRGPKTGIGKEYDVDRLHGRLLLGVDRLWVAAYPTLWKGERPFCGLVITSIGPPPKDRPGLRSTEFFFKEKSITIHLIAGKMPYRWIDDAVEKITAYARAQGCRQAFVLARSRWRRYGLRFYPHFEKLGLARDRFSGMGKYGGRNSKNARQRPGHFLLVLPLPPGMKYETARRSTRRMFFESPKGEGYAA